MDHVPKAYPVLSRIRGLKGAQGMLTSLRKFSRDEVAQKRMEIISFYDEFGEKATLQAFGADRRVISRWRKRLNASGGRLMALIPHSTKPKRVRRSQTHSKIIPLLIHSRLYLVVKTK